jgi:hypothetical protein
MAVPVCEIKDNAKDAHDYIETLDDTKFLSNAPFMESGKQKFMITSKT